jgi:hypothetical protein
LIIDQIDVVSVVILEAKDSAPVAGHRHGPQPFELSLKRVKPKAGKDRISNLSGFVEAGHDPLDLVHARRRETAAIVVFAKTFKSSLLKRSGRTIIRPLMTELAQF